MTLLRWRDAALYLIRPAAPPMPPAPDIDAKPLSMALSAPFLQRGAFTVAAPIGGRYG